ncbi:MAG: zinc-ribbon domain-containing protein, partial [Desulfobacterales bacterium]
MQCPKCNAENPVSRKFCRECGEKFQVMCPHCNSENIPGDKFCGECGYKFDISEGLPPVDYTRPDSYTPKHLADKILNNRSAIEGERKIVTVLFADVANYTAMAEKLDPEIVH